MSIFVQNYIDILGNKHKNDYMSINNIISNIKKFLFSLMPSTYVLTALLGVISVVALFLSPYLDSKSNHYKLANLEDSLRLSQLSRELIENNVEYKKYNQILSTEYALHVSARNKLTDERRFKLAKIITAEANKYNIDPILVVSLIYVESSFNSDSKSNKNARGLMQLLPDTASYIQRKIGDHTPIENLHDDETNIRLGVAYLNYLIEKNNGNIEYALIAYNMGPGNLYRAIAKNQIPKTYSNKVFKEFDSLNVAIDAIKLDVNKYSLMN